MSYEDLEKARVERAAKDTAKAKGKGKRGRKRKGPTTEEDKPEPKAKVASVLWSSDVQVAPVAKMI